ncbi:MAG: MurT ligase domain-containing protein [Anaerofustis sp.]
MRFYFALWIAKLAEIAIKLIDPTRGTDFPGKLAYRIDRNFMRGFRQLDTDRVIFITGTNGKSTTTNLLYHTMKCAGKKTIANLTGSNMLNGAASCLIAGSDWRGRVKADVILIEVDERSLPYIIGQLPGKYMLITNIMQDQVHRNGDPDFIYQLVRKNIKTDMTLFLNNDEPRSKSYETCVSEVRYFGVSRNSQSYQKDGMYDVTMPCPHCFSKIEFEYMNSANIGRFHCDYCGFCSSETALTQIEEIDFGQKHFSVRGVVHPLTYDVPIMLYNYAAVSAVANYFGIADETVSNAYSDFVNLEGRMDILHYRGKQIHYLRIKQGNPETIQMAVDAIALDPSPKAVAFGMCIIPERRPQWVPHYTNTYYAYESNFKPIRNDRTDLMVFSDYIAYDQVNRLLYDGFDENAIKVINSEDPKTVLDALCDMESEAYYLVAPVRNIKIFKSFLKKAQEGDR